MRATAETTPPPARILLVDDHPVMRHGLAQLVADCPGLEVCGEAGNGNDAVEMVRRLNPDLLLLDLDLPDGNGVDVIRRLRVLQPALRILACSMHDRRLFETHVLRAGGHGYVTKDQAWPDIEAAVRQVLAGNVAFSANAVAALAAATRGSDGTPELPASRALSGRETAIFDLVGQGFGPTAIATQLNLSPRTIETHSAAIRRKLHLKSPTDLRRYAIQARSARQVPPP